MTKSLKNNPPVLSIVVLNYNAGEYLGRCLKSIDSSDISDNIEVIVADNLSTDTSFDLAQKIKLVHPKIKFIFTQNNQNGGFSWGNNQGLKTTNPSSKHVLFLNPDTTVESNTIQGMVDYFEKHQEVDAATCNVILAVTGATQPECHRGFPTPWNSFCYFFLPFLPNSYIINKDLSIQQPIDCCVGAFFMMKRKVGDSIGWWNENYFMYGEDLDFCFKIKQKGYQLFFIPDFKITHYQGISSGIKKTKTTASRETKARSARATTNAMRIFYQENLIETYHPLLRPLIWQGINLLELYRVFKAKYL